MPTKKKKVTRKKIQKRSSAFFYTLVGLFALSVATFLGVNHSQSLTQAVAGISAPTPTPTPSLSSCIGLGDINMDGKINAADVVLAQRIAVNLPKTKGSNYSTEEKRRADVNRDGKVNAQDIVLIQRKITGLIAFFPSCGLTPTPTASYATPTKSQYPTPTRIFLSPTPTPKPVVYITPTPTRSLYPTITYQQTSPTPMIKY